MHATIAARGRPPIHCVMRDVSEQGALLEVAHPEWLPTRFHLIVDAFGIKSDCEVVRRTETAVGVRFPNLIALNGLG